MKKAKATTENVSAAARQLGPHPFRCESCDPARNAQRNLSGRSHYADPDTLRGFRATILDSGVAADGLVFWLLESVQSRPDHGGVTRRAVCFDVFGTVVGARDTWHRTTAQAQAHLRAFLAGFDAVAHTAAAVRGLAQSRMKAAKGALAALRGA